MADNGAGGGSTSIWVILLVLIIFSIFYVYALGPVTFVSSNIATAEAPNVMTGIWGWFVAWMPYLILLGFILIGVLWPIFSG